MSNIQCSLSVVCSQSRSVKYNMDLLQFYHQKEETAPQIAVYRHIWLISSEILGAWKCGRAPLRGIIGSLDFFDILHEVRDHWGVLFDPTQFLGKFFFCWFWPCFRESFRWWSKIKGNFVTFCMSPSIQAHRRIPFWGWHLFF